MLRTATLCRHPLAGFAFLVLASACGGPAGDAGGVTTARDSAGVRVVRHPPASPGASAWRLDPELEIPGTGDGGLPVLVRPVDLDVSPEGELVVLDAGERRIHVYDRHGAHVRSFARSGSGPGELRTPSRVALAADGAVGVGERLPPARHWYTPRGEHRATVRLDRGTLPEDLLGAGPGLPLMAEWGAATPAGTAVQIIRLGGNPEGGTRHAVARVDESGRVVGILARWETATRPGRPPRLFESRPTWTGDGRGGIYLAAGRRYEIRHLDAGGRLLAVLRRDGPRRPVTPAMRRHATELFGTAVRAGGAPPQVVRRLADGLQAADSLPAVHGVWRSPPDDVLWVGIPGAREDGSLETAAFDRYGPDGAYLGRVAAPDGFRLRSVHGEDVYGVDADAVGAPRIRRLRLRRAGEAGDLPPGSPET